MHNQIPSASDPYALLNVSRDATANEIRRAYTFGSRAFHPDKQQAQGEKIDESEAQDAFLQLKNAYDILSDPVLRTAFDEFGIDGVHFLRSKSESNQELVNYLSDESILGSPEKVRETIKQAIEIDEVQKKMAFCPTSGQISVQCTAVPVMEGIAKSPEMENFLMHLSVGAPASTTLGGRTSMSFGGYSIVKNGIGSVAAQASVEHEILPGTDVGVEVEVGNNCKIELNTSRKMANGTYMSAAANIGIGGHQPSLMFASQRMLFGNKLHGDFSVSTDNRISLRTTYIQDMLPLFRLAFSLGPGDSSVTGSTDLHFAELHKGKVSFGIGLAGIHLKALVTRVLSKFAKFSIGVKLHSLEGLAWLFKLERGGVSFNVPITMCTSVDPLLTIIVSSASILIDEIIGDLIKRSKLKIAPANRTEGGYSSKSNHFAQHQKAIENAKIQIRLMEKQALNKRKIEEKKDGLVILNAIYAVNNGDTLDVCTQLQFWVIDSKLNLPASSKKYMLGFYDVTGPIRLQQATKASTLGRQIYGVFDLFRTILISEPKSLNKVLPQPILTVRYMFHGSVYELSVKDDEALSLPSHVALKLGTSDIVS